MNHLKRSNYKRIAIARAQTLGNHEFDDGVNGVVPFLEQIKSPVVVANIDDSAEPTFQRKYQKSIIFDKYERQIGVIGVITKQTDVSAFGIYLIGLHSTHNRIQLSQFVQQMSETGKLRFLDEVEAVGAEAARLKGQGVDIIIVLSHCGLEVDYRIAKSLGADVDVIVGGHSHSFMFNETSGQPTPGPDRPMDSYPAVVQSRDGHKTLIVQASSNAKYVGDLTVYFDRAGQVVKWEGAPIFLDASVVKDPQVVRELIPWRAIVDEQSKRVIGHTRVELNRTECYFGECNLGNLFADSFVHHYAANEAADEGMWTKAAIALVNAGGMRASFSKGGKLGEILPTRGAFAHLSLHRYHLRRDDDVHSLREHHRPHRPQGEISEGSAGAQRQLLLEAEPFHSEIHGANCR